MRWLLIVCVCDLDDHVCTYYTSWFCTVSLFPFFRGCDCSARMYGVFCDHCTPWEIKCQCMYVWKHPIIFFVIYYAVIHIVTIIFWSHCVSHDTNDNNDVMPCMIRAVMALLLYIRIIAASSVCCWLWVHVPRKPTLEFSGNKLCVYYP